MAQLKEGSVIKKSTGDEIIATETQLNNHNTDVAAHNDIRQQINTLDADVVTHKADYATPHKYEDEGQDPNWSGVRYRLVMINGEPFMEVVEI